MNFTPIETPYTPTEKQVEFAYIDRRDFESQVSGEGRLADEVPQAEFARFIAHVQAEAVRAAAAYWGENPDEVDDETPRDARNWLRAYADILESKANPTT